MDTMLICAAGDIHGALDRFYADVIKFEASLGVRFDWILHVGDFGAWPDEDRVDGATRRHDGAGNFPVWWAERRPAPRPTVFIKGNHEDFVWLDAQSAPEILPGLFYLANGKRFDLTVGKRTLVVGGMGGCFGPSDYERTSSRLQGYAKRHYTRDEIDALASAGRVDVLLTHDAPAGVRFEHHRRGDGFVSEAAGLDELLERVRPRICFFGHHHARFDSEVAGVPCLSLNKVGMPGNLVAVDLEERGRGWSIVGEWPRGFQSLLTRRGDTRLMMNEKHIGSDLDAFLDEQGLRADVEARALKRVVADRLERAMQEQHVTKAALARRLRTSRTAVSRLLDPDSPAVTLQTLVRAAHVLGKEVVIEVL